MTTQHSDPPREPTDKPSAVLSDSTDLDALLEAILGDEVDPVAAPGPPRDEITSPAAVADELSEPTVVPPPPTEAAPESAVAHGATPDENDAWGFVSEDPQAGDEIADDGRAVRQDAPAASAPSPSDRTWRDTLRASRSKQLLLVAALSAATLITVSAIRLGDVRTTAATKTLPSSEAPALVQSSSPIEVPSAVKASDSSQVEVWAAAREPEPQPRAIRRTVSRRPNEVTDERSSRLTKPAFVEAPLNTPTASPVVTSPAAAERIPEAPDRDAAPTRTLTSEGEQRRVINSEPTNGASGASVVNGAEPAPTAVAPVAAAPVAAAVPRRTAARLLTGPAPEYPAALRTARIGGTVEVRFTIDSSGKVTNVQSLTGPLQLRSAAEEAVRRWRYEAARIDNLAVETQISVRFNFDPSTTRRPQE